MTDFPTDRAFGSPTGGIISTGSHLTEMGAHLLNAVGNFNTPAAWGTANQARAFPFTVSQPVRTLWAAWYNGTITTAPNVDVGVYDTNLKLLVSTGSTLQAGASGIQTVALASTELAPGDYYMAMNVSGTGSTFDGSNNIPAIGLRACGAVQMASAFPLPATFVPAVTTATLLPLFAIGFAAVL